MIVAPARPPQKPTRISIRTLTRTFAALGLHAHSHVIVHAPPMALRQAGIHVETFLGALLEQVGLVMMPGFTPQTMVAPRVGPPDNGLDYDAAHDNSFAEFWRADLPVDPNLGTLPERFRCLPDTHISLHPVLRFLAHGQQAQAALATQTLTEPLAPLRWLTDHDGQVLLVGATPRDNFSLHLALQMAGRNGYQRWALARDRVVTVPNFPGEADRLADLAPHLSDLTHEQQVGALPLVCLPLAPAIERCQQLLG